jgi:hypothetical protein
MVANSVAELPGVWCQERASNRPVIVLVGFKNGESAKRVRGRNQVQNVTKIG